MLKITNNQFISMLVILPFLLFTKNVYSETLQEYVEKCKEALGVDSIPSFSCLDGTQTSKIANTRIGVLDMGESGQYIDAVWLCRGVNTNTNKVDLNGLILHNIGNGATCFFDAKRGGVSLNAPSPDSAQATNYWLEPEELNTVPVANCSQCHTNGPFISTNNISEELAYFGLFNNGRDQFLDRYYIVGEAHQDWNESILNSESDNGCANACHAVTAFSASTAAAGSWMPPSNSSSSPTQDSATYMWINRDRTTGTGDLETRGIIESGFSDILLCADREPIGVEARVVGSAPVFTRSSEELEFFNIHDGIKCLNSEQEDGTCHDYSIRLMCNGAWSQWYDYDDPNGTGDWEVLANYPAGVVCPNPTRIQARYTPTGTSSLEIIEGTPDRLRKFSPVEGLECKNVDQPDSKCNNYAIRFICP